MRRHDPVECGKAAFATLTQLGLTPTPDNFAIWYEYHAGMNPELRHLMDILLAAPTRCDDQTMAAVHRKFFLHARERESLQVAMARIQSLLQEVSRVVDGAGQQARDFGTAVRDTTQAMAPDDTLPRLIRRLRDEARAMAERTEAVGRHLTDAVERIQVLERSLDDLRHDAATDGLTKLPNRRSFDTRLHEAAGQAMNSGAPLMLVMIDIDHFKRINDNWGHQTGDQVLRLVAGVLRGAMREGDFVARYGGEEFGLILPATSVETAEAIAERIRRGFEGRDIVTRSSGQAIGRLTLSAGGAGYEPGERLGDWVERADAALYAAKNAGRNRVVFAAPAAASASMDTPAAVA